MASLLASTAMNPLIADELLSHDGLKNAPEEAAKGSLKGAQKGGAEDGLKGSPPLPELDIESGKRSSQGSTAQRTKGVGAFYREGKPASRRLSAFKRGGLYCAALLPKVAGEDESSSIDSSSAQSSLGSNSLSGLLPVH